MTRHLAAIVLLSILASPGTTPAADEDPVRKKLDIAKAAQVTALSEYKREVEKWFTKEDDAARMLKTGATDKVKQIKVERKMFVDQGVLPKRFPAAIRQKPAKATEALIKSYTIAADEYTRQKMDDRAAAVEKELATLKQGGSPTPNAVELPERLQQEIEKATAAYQKAEKLTERRLVAAMDAELEAVRKQARLTGKAKQDLLDAITTEKEIFEKSGMIPFSPRMRGAALNYIRDLRQDERPLVMAYDKALEYLIRTKHDDASERLKDEKKRALPLKLVGRFKVVGTRNIGSGTMSLYSNGLTATPSITWSLEPTRYVTVNRAPGSPPGGTIFWWYVQNNGHTLTGKNPKDGFAYTGERVDPEK